MLVWCLYTTLIINIVLEWRDIFVEVLTVFTLQYMNNVFTVSYLLAFLQILAELFNFLKNYICIIII